MLTILDRVWVSLKKRVHLVVTKEGFRVRWTGTDIGRSSSWHRGETREFCGREPGVSKSHHVLDILPENEKQGNWYWTKQETCTM